MTIETMMERNSPRLFSTRNCVIAFAVIEAIIIFSGIYLVSVR